MKLNLTITNHDILPSLVGVQDRNLTVFKQYLGVTISIYESDIITDAPKEMLPLLETIFSCLIQLALHQVLLNERDIIYIIKLAEKDQLEDVLELYKKRSKILTNFLGKPIYPKTFNQKKYVHAMEKTELIFGVGPAGTGKTYLAVAYAVALLKENKVRKLILTRPVVEAGESLGFLPGDLKDKVDPYLIPLYDALHEMLGREQTDSLLQKGVIEIAPLAYMRGRTLEQAIVILDEAQNTTKTQMKMFLTRLGFSSKMIITGDPSQIDLNRNQLSGLKDALKILDGMKDISIVEFEKIDVIRHPLVQRILERYDADENPNL